MKKCNICGALVPNQSHVCLVCGYKVGTKHEAVIKKENAGGDIAVQPPIQESQKDLIFLSKSMILIILVNVIAVSLLGAVPYLKSGNKTRAEDAVIYVTKDNTLKFMSPAMETPETIATNFLRRNSKTDDNLVKASPNGSKIAYLKNYRNGYGDLYVRDFSASNSLQNETENQDILVANDVHNNFFFTERENYLVYHTKSQEIFASDLKKAWLIEASIDEIIDYKDNKMLLTKRSYDETDEKLISLYLCKITGSGAADGGINLIDTNIKSIADYTDEFDRFVYHKKSETSSLDICTYEVSTDERRTLEKSVDKIVDADAKTFTVLFQRTAQNMMHFDSIFVDDKARDDDKLTEPELEDYPLLQAFFEENGEDAKPTNVNDDEDIFVEMKEFEKANDAYHAKTARDKMREDAVNSIDRFVAAHPKLYNLYINNNSTTRSTLLSDGSFLPFEGRAKLDAQNGLSVWTGASFKGFEKIVFSTFASPLTLPNMLDESISDYFYAQKFGHSTTPIEISHDVFYSSGFVLSENADKIYFLIAQGSPLQNHAPNRSHMYYAPIANGQVGNMLLVDDSVDAFGERISGSRVVYLKNRFAIESDVYTVDGSKTEQIGENVLYDEENFSIENDGKSMLYIQKYDSNTEVGNLFLYTKQPRQVTTNVHEAYYVSDSLIYFVKNKADSENVLSSFTNSGEAVVENDVAIIMR